MLTFFQNPATFIGLSIAGASVVTLGTLISALAYRGRRGEPYSPLNHYISELGEVGVSRLAWVFNLGLILSGICLIPACISLGLLMPGILPKIGMMAGVIMAGGLLLVGVFPMDKLKPHGRAALTFFRGGLLMVLLFSLAIGFQPQSGMMLPRGYSLAGLPAILGFSGFLLLMGKTDNVNHDPLQPLEQDRPKIWIMTIVEWSIFLTIVAWFLVIAFGLSG